MGTPAAASAALALALFRAVAWVESPEPTKGISTNSNKAKIFACSCLLLKRKSVPGHLNIKLFLLRRLEQLLGRNDAELNCWTVPVTVFIEIIYFVLEDNSEKT